LLSLKFYPNRHEEVVKTPGYDDVVVAADDHGHHRRTEADSAQPRMHAVPNDVGTTAKLLSHGQLQQHERHSLNHDHDQKWDDKGA